MEKKVKVLFIGTTNIYGGVGHIMFEFLKNIDRDRIQIDFLYYKDATDKEKEIIHSYGGEFYLVPRYSQNFSRFRKELKKFYSEHHYDVVHCHASTSTVILYSFPVWKDKSVRVFYQSHIDTVSGKANKILHRMLRPLVIKYSEKYIAVSEKASLFMYGKKITRKNQYELLKNGIQIKEFQFESNVRNEIRSNLKLSDEYVVANVGRFSKQKNHEFILKVFENIYIKDKKCRLLLIGNGELEAELKRKVQEMGLKDAVIFYGTTTNVPSVLCASDSFLFPSLWEGLGIVAIEAQANGLPVIASTMVPKEADITENMHYLDLEKNTIDEWGDLVLSFKENQINRNAFYNELVDNGYDISKVTKQLEQLYLEK